MVTTERDEIAARWTVQRFSLRDMDEARRWLSRDGHMSAGEIEIAYAVADFHLSERARLFAEPSEGMVAAMTGIISDYIDEWRGPADAKDALAALRALGEAAR